MLIHLSCVPRSPFPRALSLSPLSPVALGCHASAFLPGSSSVVYCSCLDLCSCSYDYYANVAKSLRVIQYISKTVTVLCRALSSKSVLIFHLLRRTRAHVQYVPICV